MPHPPDTDELLQCYAAGTCSREEREQVLAILRTPNGLRRMRAVMDEEQRRAERAEASLDRSTSDRLFERIDSRIREQERAEEPPPRPGAASRGARRRCTGRRIAVAAAVVLALVAVVVLLRLGLPVSAPASLEVATAAGQQATIRLADGTHVRLNEGSKLSYPERFRGAVRRAVRLEGEAHFDVAHDADVPFVIDVADAQVRVVGTAFDVKARRAGQVLVAVEEGAVALSRRRAEGDEASLLRAGDVGVLTDSGVARHRSADVANYWSWSTGRLAFTDAPLADVVRQLEHLYDTDIEIRDPGLAALRLTAQMKRGDLAYVLGELTAALGIRYSRQGGAMYITNE